MSTTTGTLSEVLFANGFAYPAAAASSTSPQLLMAGGTGKYQQPFFPGGYFQQSRIGQVAAAEFAIILAGQSSATTAIFTAGLATAPNTGSGGTLVTANAFTCTSFASGTVHGRVLISNFGSGYLGVNSTNLWSTMSLIFNNSSTTGGGVAAGGPTQFFPASSGVDFSVNQWFYLTVTFSTASVSNSATLQSVVLYGLN